MRVPIFAAAIKKWVILLYILQKYVVYFSQKKTWLGFSFRCHQVLEPKGIDIVRILTDPDKTIYDNILHSFVGIAAVQIGLTDILTQIGIVPDNIIGEDQKCWQITLSILLIIFIYFEIKFCSGHSVGELGCAYADGCFTAEEMILAAYSRGLVSVQTPFIRGSMAAVGLGYKAVSENFYVIFNIADLTL